MNHSGVMKLPLWKKIMYALGQLGWSLTSFALGNYLVNFYQPSQTGDINFPAFFTRAPVFLGITIVGIIFAISRMFDAVTDPVIAGLSDRGRFKVGRRKFFLMVSIVPFAALSYLAFVPPVAGESTLNAIYLGIMVILYYLFMTMYVTPFFALLSELGHNSAERLQLSTMISVTWAIGALIGSQTFALQNIFENSGMASLQAFRMAVLIFSILGFIFMLMPIIFIDEHKYCESHVSKEGIFEAVKTAFKNKNFLKFTLSDFAYWVSITLIQSGIAFYVTILLEQGKENVSFLQALMFLLSFVFYVPVHFLAKKIGKKRALIVAFVMFAITFVYVTMLGKISFIPLEAQGLIMVVLAAIPLAIFGILPNAVIADIAEYDGIKTGNYKSGIFFGARTFMSKMGQAVAGIILPSMLARGQEIGDDIGIRMTAIAAIVFIIGGLVLLLFYNEKEINQVIEQK